MSAELQVKGRCKSSESSPGNGGMLNWRLLGFWGGYGRLFMGVLYFGGVRFVFFSLGHICLTGKEVSVTENKTSLISL